MKGKLNYLKEEDFQRIDFKERDCCDINSFQRIIYNAKDFVAEKSEKNEENRQMMKNEKKRS